MSLHLPFQIMWPYPKPLNTPISLLSILCTIDVNTTTLFSVPTYRQSKRVMKLLNKYKVFYAPVFA